MNKILSISKNMFFKQVTLLAGGTLFAQLVNLVTLPLLTRIYLPEDFGAFAVMTASTALLSALVSLRYEDSILAVNTSEDAKVAMYLVMFLSVVTGSIIAVFWICTSYLIRIDAKFIMIGFISIFYAVVNCFIQAMYYLCNRSSLYGVMTRGRVYSAIILALVSISWGYIVGTMWGLLFGSLLGAIFNSVFLWFASGSVKELESPLTVSRLIDCLKENRRFPKFLVFSSLLDRSGSQGYLLLFTKVYSETVVGALSLYNKVAGLPGLLIGRAIGDVFKRNASEQLRKNGKCRQLVLKTCAVLLGIAIIPFLLLFFFGPEIFTFVFGQDWKLAGDYAQILAPVFLLGFIVSPISSLIYLENNQKYDLLLQATLLFFLITGLGFAFSYGNAYWAVVAYALSYSLKYIVEISICWKIASGEK